MQSSNKINIGIFCGNKLDEMVNRSVITHSAIRHDYCFDNISLRETKFLFHKRKRIISENIGDYHFDF